MNQSQQNTRFWWKRCFAPKNSDVSGPQVKHGGQFCYIFQSDYDLMALWPYIKQSTEEAKLGHYSAFSNDRKVIAIHHSDPNDTIKMRQIELELEGLDVQAPYWKTQAECHRTGAQTPHRFRHIIEREHDYSRNTDENGVVRQRQWTDWVFANEDVNRVQHKYEGWLAFFSFEDFNDIQGLWTQIEEMTVNGNLGYLSTTDNEIIAVHCSNQEQKDRTKSELDELRVKNVRWTTEVEALFRAETAFQWINETNGSTSD